MATNSQDQDQDAITKAIQQSIQAAQGATATGTPNDNPAAPADSTVQYAPALGGTEVAPGGAAEAGGYAGDAASGTPSASADAIKNLAAGVGALTGGATKPDASAAYTPVAAGTRVANRQTIYHPDLGGIFGFETKDLQGDKSDAKYSDTAKNFSTFLKGGGQVARGDLSDAVNFARQHGFANATQVGEDKIDYGNGQGPIDVLADQGNGKDLITFQNMIQGGGGPVGPGSGSGEAGGGAAIPEPSIPPSQLFGGVDNTINPDIYNNDFFKQLLALGAQAAGPAATKQGALAALLNQGSEGAPQQ